MHAQYERAHERMQARIMLHRMGRVYSSSLTLARLLK
jgi:hypothetical protein